MSHDTKFDAIDFFAGSDLLTEGLTGRFNVVWANDDCARKKPVYTRNFGHDHFRDRSIEEVCGETFVLLVDNGEVRTRLPTIREAARLMGVRDSYKFPGSYDDAYLALGIPMHFKSTILVSTGVV